jgi:hypothetical protein
MAEVDKINEELPMEDNSIPEEGLDVVLPEEDEVPEETVEENFYGNLAETMDERALSRLALDLIADYKKDRVSRLDWEQTYVQGLDLLGFKYQDMTRPFQGATGVTHPMLAESVTQFQAQAYKELLPAEGPVRTEVVGLETPDILKQSERVKDFMNYMLMEKMEEYTPDFDQLLFYLPLSGSAFKKFIMMKYYKEQYLNLYLLMI